MNLPHLPDDARRILERIQDRLLWLAVYAIHYANARRKNPSPDRVGGHQSSSTSALTLLTARYFKLLRPGDRIAVKPTAAPIFWRPRGPLPALRDRFRDHRRGRPPHARVGQASRLLRENLTHFGLLS